MYTFIALSAFLVTIGVTLVQSQVCSDCMHYDKCPPALYLAINKRDQATTQLFKLASCGFDRSTRRIIPKVCCSRFPSTEQKVPATGTTEDTRIDNHPNLNLLATACGDIKGPRIVGGKKADLFEYPWMALISHNTRDGFAFKCGGSIINKRYVLTAAHCVYNKSIAGVRVGEYNIDEEYDCQDGTCTNYIQDVPVEKSIVHKDYHGLPRVVNDIALLRVGVPIEFGHPNVDPICLPKTAQLRSKPLANEQATVTGWGITENGRDSPILLEVSIPIKTAEECSSLYNRYAKPGAPDATENQLCAGTYNKDSCNGDSGGPLILPAMYNNVNRFVQYGLVSHGPGRCGSDFPGVYTDVTKFMGWILDNMEPL
ncbi:CLIP domain-containing serine protease HP8-like [Epargyreus clarus]|uniref:CLIP domain-containing serine protease HP8-like n=1 Tax=Epargyreus clarus TaxID=520877 RepID=UPI003C2CF28E